MATDLNASVGTVTRDAARHTGAAHYWVNPTNTNDGSTSSYGYIASGLSGFSDYLKSDLGAAYRISSFKIYVSNTPDKLTKFQYSTDGTTWFDISYTESGGRQTSPNGATLTFSAAIDARYWAVGAVATGYHSTINFNTWQIIGTTIPAAMVCAFSGTPLTGAPTLAVTFTDASTGTPTSWAWDFGDGGTSTSQNPSHNYTSVGRYNVTLTITRSGDGATDFLTKVWYVVVDGPGVFIDWDGDGFDPGGTDDVTAYVTGWTIARGGGAEITGGSQPGTATITLKNTSDRFNPRYAAGPLYGLLTDGVPVWIGVTDDGKVSGATANGLFGGRITDITLIPSPGRDEPGTVEIQCEDALGWYGRLPARVDYAEGRSHGALRAAALADAGETRTTLANEIATTPLSHADSDLAQVLAAINTVNGTRHLAKPADLYTDWYSYTTRNRQWRLDATVDASLDAAADHVTGTSGWRLAADTVTNQQRATVLPVSFTPATFTVWEADAVPFGVTDLAPYSVTIGFEDFVADSALDFASTGDAVTDVYTPFATGGKVDLTVGVGDAATITALSIEGRLGRRLPQESYTADDTTSQAVNARGIREGSEISGEFLGVLANARGIAEHVVWRYGDPQFRPTLTVENWMPEQFQLDLYDTIALTSTHLGLTAHIFEIVGLTHTGNIAAATVQHHVTEYVLQECKVQADPEWFYLDDDPGSLLDDAAKNLAY